MTPRKRKELPTFWRLNMEVDINEIIRELEERDYLSNADKELSASSPFVQRVVLAHDKMNRSFPTADGSYKMIPLTTLPKELAKIPSEWSVMGSVRGAKRGKEIPVISDYRKYTEPTEWVTPSIRKLLDRFPNHGRSRISITRVGSGCEPHIDSDTDFQIRIHVPLVTHPKSFFAVKNQKGEWDLQYLPADGGVWFINTGLEHYFQHSPLATQPRVHILIDVNTQDCIQEVPSVDINAS